MLELLEQHAIHTVASVVSFVLGGMIGSFLNVCVYRIPMGLSVVSPRSRCPRCENPVLWYDNIPVFSWLLLQAKCRFCSQPISWQYPLVEGITATLFLIVYLRFGFTVATPIYMLLSASLVLVTFVDLTDWTIPNEVTFPGIPLGIACAVGAMIYEPSGLQLNDPIMSIGGLLIGGGSLYALDKFALLVLKKPGMGFGDVKLMAMLGAFFGVAGVIENIVIASMIGSVVGIGLMIINRNDNDEDSPGNYLPFGPSIALAGIIVMLYGPQIKDAYLGTLGM